MDATRAGPVRESSLAGGGPRHAPPTQQAVLQATQEVKRSADGIATALAALATRPPTYPTKSLGSMGKAFTGFLTFGTRHLGWIDGALGDTALLAVVASEVADPEMQRGLSRMAGPRLQAALFGAMLLATWLDFLTLADAVLRQCPAYGQERLFTDLRRVQEMLGPSLAALASPEPERVEAAAIGMPALLAQLQGEFHAIRRGVRVAMESSQRVVAAAQFMELLTMSSAARLLMPRLPPAAPVTLGVGVVMGSGGVMVGSRVVVTAEWVERLRQQGTTSMRYKSSRRWLMRRSGAISSPAWFGASSCASCSRVSPMAGRS